MIECMLDVKVSDMIDKYRNCANDKDLTKKFIFNAEVLNPSLTLREAGIRQYSNIFVVSSKRIKPAENDSV